MSRAIIPILLKNRDIFVCVKNVFNSTLHSPHSTPVNTSSTAPLSRKANEHINPPIRGSIAIKSPLTGKGIYCINPPIRGSIDL